MASNIPRSLFDGPTPAILKMRSDVELQKVKDLIVGASPIVNRPTPDVPQDKSEWLIREDYSILQVIQDLQGIPLSLTILMPNHIPNWDLVADAVNNMSHVYRSAKNCKSRFENVIVMREESDIVNDHNPKKPKKTKGIYKTKNNRPMKTSHLYQQDRNASYTSIFLKRSKVIVELAQKRKAQADWVKNQKPTQNILKGLSLNDCAIKYNELLSPMEIASNCQERIQREKQKNQPPGQVQLSKANLQPGSAVFATLSKPLTNSIIVSKSFGTAAGTFATITKALGQSGVSIFAQGAVQNAANAAAGQVCNLMTSASGTSSAPAVVSVAGLATVQLAPSQRITGTAATTIATAVANQMNSQITTQSNITQLSQIKAIRQAALIRQKGKSGVQTKGATTITNQQLRQLQIQQKLLNQDRKGSKGTTNLTRLAKVPNKGFLRTTASISAPVNVIGNSQQVKGLPSAMTGQQMQQAMKAMPQNLPVVVTATPSLPGIQHTATTLCQEPGVVASSVKAQTTTLPSTTLTTSNVLKGTPAVIVGQQQTAAILQQMPASFSGITGQHAVQARASQAQGQQFPIQVQPYAHFLVTPQAQVVMPQMRIQQLSQNASTINNAQPIAVQNEPQASIILSLSGTIVQQMPANSTIQSSTHVVMHTVAITNTTSTNTALSSPQTTSVQAVIQAARQQQQAAVQQQKASPFTMRLHDPQN